MRVLLTPVPVGFGTTARCLAIAAECRRRGHDVLFACHKTLHQRIEAQGFSCVAIRDTEIMPKERKPAVEQYLSGHTKALLWDQYQDLLGVLDHFIPDVAVSGHNTMTMVAAAAKNVISASVFHPAILEATSPKMLLSLLAQWARTRWVIRTAAVPRAVPPSPYGDLSFIPSVPELVRWPWLLLPSIAQRKDTALLLGALLAEDIDRLPEPAELREALEVPKHVPFIFGTVGGAVAQEKYIEVLAKGLAEADVHAILSVGSGVSDEALAGLSHERVRLVRSVPDDLRAFRAADAFLWHGGHETMLAGVSCGRPGVGVPFQFDQDTNARVLEEAGAGLRIPKAELRSARIAKAVTSLISEPSYRTTAQRLAETSRQAGGAGKLVDLLERAVDAKLGHSMVFEGGAI